jgi:hypothetical protein
MRPKQFMGMVLVLAALGLYGVDQGYIVLPDNIVPTPTPAPPETLYGVVVSETGDRTPEESIVLSSPIVRSLFDDPSHFRVIDPDTQVTADLQRLKDKAKERGDTTTLFLVEPNGTIHYEGDLPNTVEAFQLLVREIKQ